MYTIKIICLTIYSKKDGSQLLEKYVCSTTRYSLNNKKNLRIWKYYDPLEFQIGTSYQSFNKI